MIARTHRVRWVLAGVGVLLGALAYNDAATAAALTGTVSSQREGAMEGVIVSAKKQGGTIAVAPGAWFFRLVQ